MVELKQMRELIKTECRTWELFQNNSDKVKISCVSSLAKLTTVAS